MAQVFIKAQYKETKKRNFDTSSPVPLAEVLAIYKAQKLREGEKLPLRK